MSENALKVVAYGATSSLAEWGQQVLEGASQALDVFVEFVTPVFQRAWDWIRGLFRGNVPQNMFIEGMPELGNEVYRQQVKRSTSKTYTVRHKLRNSSHIITGISCLPMDKELQSPEAEVVDGGINYNEVKLLLTPVEDGEWGCIITMCSTKAD